MAMMVADSFSSDNLQLYNGDCVPVLKDLPAEKIHYIIYSPPFESLYVYSDDPRDISNCRTAKQFWEHYDYVINETFRILMPGRLVSVHCLQIPSFKSRDGFIGLKDFRGDIIRHHEKAGFIYHSEVMIRKDPVIAMQRTKAIGLLHKQLVKDSCMSRMALADYVVTMRKLGVNPEPVSGRLRDYYGTDRVGIDEEDKRSIAVWQRYAEPMWLDIVPGDTLSGKYAREEADERHIAPLQLTVIRRCLELWSNPGDVVLSPFAGIGSECYVALQMGRKAVGVELKPSYYKQAVSNCKEARKSDLLLERR
jgi:DNA modification methylase